MKVLPDFLASLNLRDPAGRRSDPLLSQYRKNATLDCWKWLEKNIALVNAYNKTRERSIEVTRSLGNGGSISMA